MDNLPILRKKILPGAMVLGLFPGIALADDSALTLSFENDALASSDDGHFSSGFTLDWAFTPSGDSGSGDSGSGDSWTRRFASALPDALIGQADRASYRLASLIYTPNDIERRTLVEDDRPYAGLLYAGLSLYEDISADTWTQTTGMHLDVGVVGPASQAENIQREVHRITDSDRPQGWDHQLKDEPIINVSLHRQWWQDALLASQQLSHGPSAGAALGNLYTYATTGYSVRWGDDAQGIPMLAPHPGHYDLVSDTTGWQWYLFARVEGYYIAQNLTLDGNTFKDSHAVERKPWVAKASAGLVMSREGWQVAYTAARRTREFDHQEDADKFGSITLARRF